MPQQEANPLANLGVPAVPAPSAAPASTDANPLATLGTEATPASSTTTDKPGVIQRSIQGAGDFAKPIAALMAPPATPTEHVVSAISGGGAGLTAYRIAKNLVGSVDAAIKSAPGEYADAANNVVWAVNDFHNKNYRDALADAVSAGTTLAPSMVPGGQDTRDLANGIRPSGDLARPLTKDALTAGSMLAGGELLGPEEEAAQASAAARLKVNPFRAAVKGAEVAQPAAQGALTDAATAAAKDSGVAAAPNAGGFRTALDDTISKTAKAERAQYDRINQAAGTDLKNLYERESELEDAADDPSNIVQKPAIQVELQRTRMQIANGESKAAESGVDAQKAVRQAKDLTQQRYALQEVKSKLFNHESIVEGDATTGTPEKINVDSAIKAVQKLDKPSRFAPEGSPSRLEQALGEEGAKTLKQNLYDAQKLGQRAVNYQTAAKWLAGALGVGGTFAKMLGH